MEEEFGWRRSLRRETLGTATACRKNIKELDHFRNIYSFTAFLQEKLLLPCFIHFRLGRINLIIKDWCFLFTRRKHVLTLKIIANIHCFKNKPFCISRSFESTPASGSGLSSPRRMLLGQQEGPKLSTTRGQGMKQSS